MPVSHVFDRLPLTHPSVPTGDRPSLGGLATVTVHSQSYIQRLTFPARDSAPATVNPPSTDRNIPPPGVSRTCATCSYFSSTACTNLDGPLQTTASARACRLYFNIGDVERGL